MMDEKIKNLLRLSNIPNFKLMPEEEALLNAWKESQVRIVPPKVERQPRKKVKNIVEKEIGEIIEKEIGNIEES